MKTSPLARILVGLCLSALTTAASPFSTKGMKTILFLGDSITHGGHYVAVFDARLRELNGNRVPEVINLGLPSETCSGLSEPYHPFPRPDVHERLDRALARIKPDLVFACYGMNDGIYHPFSEERFAAYREGVGKLVKKVTATGARLYLVTPPPFDPMPMRKSGKLLKADAKEFGYKGIYEDYNAVMGRYADWLKTLKAPVEAVIDVRTPIMAKVAELRRDNPELTLSGDGVHIDRQGHEIFATALLNGLGLDGNSPPNADLLKLVGEKHQATHLAWLTEVGHKRPGPNSTRPFAESMKLAAAVEQKIAARFTSKDWSASVGFPSEETPVRLFNGKSLAGWRGLKQFWSVVDGQIRGANDSKVAASTYLFTEKAYRDFRLVFEVRQTMGKEFSTMHSAVCALGEIHADEGGEFGFKGPLLMFCHDWGIWDAYRRNRIFPAGQKGGFHPPSEKKGDWNQIEILVRGNRIRFVNNGELVIDFTDQPEMLKASPIGLQLHKNNRPQEFHFRGLLISENPKDRLITLH